MIVVPKAPDLLFIALGSALLLVGAIPLGWLERRHAAKLQNRQQRGRDAYHDELRALQTYHPKQRRLIFFGLGSIFLAIGLQGWLNH